MRLISKDLKHGKVKLMPESLDDLWYLSQLIESGNLAKGKAERKIKLGEAEERTRTAKKVFTAVLRVEKVEYESSLGSLRVSGTIENEVDDAPAGSHQSILVEKGSDITLEKKEWLSYHLDRLDEALKGGQSKVLIIVHDREEAYVAQLKPAGYTVLTHLSGSVEKKNDVKHQADNFYQILAREIAVYDKRLQADTIIIASPAFFAEDLIKEMKDAVLKKKIVKATCGSVSQNAIDEVLKREETKQALMDDKASKHAKLVEELLERIGTNGNVAYGTESVSRATEAGAVETILVTDAYIDKNRDLGTADAVEQMMRQTDKAKGRIAILSSKNDSGKKLDGLGGIGALLRYKVE